MSIPGWMAPAGLEEKRGRGAQRAALAASWGLFWVFCFALGPALGPVLGPGPGPLVRSWARARGWVDRVEEGVDNKLGNDPQIGTEK